MKAFDKIFQTCLALAAGIAIILAAGQPAAAAKHGHHAQHATSAALSAHSKHLARLAHKQHVARLAAAKHHAAKMARIESTHRKAPAYREHLKRLAEQHHQARLAARHAKSPAWRAHLKRLAFKQHLNRLAAKRSEEHKLKMHNVRLAKLKQHAHTAHLRTVAAGAHVARLERIAMQRENQARYQAHLANIAAHRQARERNLAAAHKARLAAHEARLAERAAWQAQARDRQREQEAANRVSSAYGITQWGTYTDGVPVQVVLVDLNKPQIKVSALLSRNGIGSSEPFSDMIERSHPKVAVTGTFFSLDNLRPIGDIVIDGNLAYFGGMGTALCITPGNYADMITVPWGHHHDWTGYDCVVACGPRLLKDGSIWLDPHAERFKDRHMLAPNSRIAVGITPGNKLMFAMTRDRIYLGKLAKVMRDLGCSQAMNLDAGTSTGFYCNGQMLATPGRRLTNAIVVHIKQPNQVSSAAVHL